MPKTPKTRKITVKFQTGVRETFFLYRVDNYERKYIGSFTKAINDGVMRLHLPREAWTWKRSAATGFHSRNEALAFKRLVDPWNTWKLRIEEVVLVEEY